MSPVVSHGPVRRGTSHPSIAGFPGEARPGQPAAPSCPLRLHSRQAALHASQTPPSWEDLLGRR